jgi:hypothetical protein
MLVDHVDSVRRTRHGWWLSAEVTELDADGVTTHGRVPVLIAGMSGGQEWTRLTATVEHRRLLYELEAL